MAAASFTRTPDCAMRPVPTMMDMGVASPRAQGQAMIRTDTALTKAKTTAGSGPRKYHIIKVSMDMEITI